MKHNTFWSTLARKLCSRKLWVCIVSFVTGVLIQCGVSENRANSIGGSIMSGAAVLAYCIGEGLADSDNKKGG